ncbi:hypothetical protein Lser_V15G16245 [Lactuca serriola]
MRVLALEYLHSLRVVHRDVKPDNLLIARDSHIKLTYFGLSKVGLINSTDNLSGPAVSGTSLLGDNETQSSLSSPSLSATETQQKRHKNRFAVGTPDYFAPEILLGTGHGTSDDWWSVGLILFDLIVGIPLFIAEYPQVKQHPYFRDIKWDTLARQKVAFVPSSESALDTSYFTICMVVAFGVEPYEHLECMENEYEALATIKASSSVLGFISTFLFNSFKQKHKKQSIFPITFKVYNVGKEATIVLQLKGDCSLGYLHIT